MNDKFVSLPASLTPRGKITNNLQFLEQSEFSIIFSGLWAKKRREWCFYLFNKLFIRLFASLFALVARHVSHLEASRRSGQKVAARRKKERRASADSRLCTKIRFIKKVSFFVLALFRVRSERGTVSVRVHARHEAPARHLRQWHLSQIPPSPRQRPGASAWTFCKFSFAIVKFSKFFLHNCEFLFVSEK